MMAPLGQSNNGIVEACEIYGVPYIYLGWMIDDTLAHEWVDAVSGGHHESMRDEADEGNPFDHNMEALDMKWDINPSVVDDDWVVSKHALDSGIDGGNTIFRLRKGAERFLITDINNADATTSSQSQVAVMWDSIMECQNTSTMSPVAQTSYSWTAMSNFVNMTHIPIFQWTKLALHSAWQST